MMILKIILPLFVFQSFAQGYDNPPGILRMSEEQRVKKGESVQVTCLVVGTPDPVISWYLNGERYLIYSNSRTNEGLMSTALFPSLQRSSTIICRAGNYLGLTEQSTQILVEEPKIEAPRFVLRPPEVVRYNQLRQSVTIRCAAQGFPVPDVYWELGGKKIMSQSLTMTNAVGAILVLRNLEQANYYTCVARSHAGEARAVVAVVRGQNDNFDPRILDMPKRVFHRSGRPLTLTCVVTGRPLPRPTWWVNGRPLPSRDNRTDISWSSTFTAAAVKVSNNYTCRATVRGKSVVRSIEVLVTG